MQDNARLATHLTNTVKQFVVQTRAALVTCEYFGKAKLVMISIKIHPCTIVEIENFLQ